jgi:hypothetical protein
MMSPNQKSAKNDKLEKCCFPAETLEFFGFNVDFQKVLTTDIWPGDKTSTGARHDRMARLVDRRSRQDVEAA